jgi:signal peptidase complex subunit 3
VNVIALRGSWGFIKNINNLYFLRNRNCKANWTNSDKRKNLIGSPQMTATFSSRFFAVLEFCALVLAGALIVNIITGIFMMKEPNIEHFKIHNEIRISPQKFWGKSAMEGDAALLTFDLKADFRPLWTWNTKQLFIYVVVNYETEVHKVNQVVIWDRIIQQKEDAVLKLEKELAEYPVVDKGFNLRGIKANATVYWDMSPVAGFILRGSKGEANFKFPEKYT